MSKGDEAFLSRWSRLKKQGGDKPREAPDSELPAAQQAVAPPVEVDERDLEEIRRELNLPDPATMDKNSDFTPFMKEGVPAILRKQALRMLWRSDPVLANLDGLNEYDEDYRAAMMVTEVIKSAWKPGRGYADPEPAEIEDASHEQAAIDGEGAADSLASVETAENIKAPESEVPDGSRDDGEVERRARSRES